MEINGYCLCGNMLVHTSNLRILLFNFILGLALLLPKKGKLQDNYSCVSIPMTL